MPELAEQVQVVVLALQDRRVTVMLVALASRLTSSEQPLSTALEEEALASRGLAVLAVQVRVQAVLGLLTPF